jgi:hypothetical protein
MKGHTSQPDSPIATQAEIDDLYSNQKRLADLYGAKVAASQDLERKLEETRLSRDQELSKMKAYYESLLIKERSTTQPSE